MKTGGIECVVDTNVPVVANGGSVQASKTCVLSCIAELIALQKGGRLVIDNDWRILKEYIANLRSQGQPGPGDAFLKWVLTNSTKPRYCEQVQITPTADQRGFREFPLDRSLSTFDPEDRKFVAVSVAHPGHPPILQAVDASWWPYRDALAANGVTVQFLCPDEMKRLSR